MAYLFRRKLLNQNYENSSTNNLTIRVIPRLDVKGPNLVKGIGFDGWRVLGTPEYFTEVYNEESADEIFYQDTVASLFQREPCFDVIERTAKHTKVPLTVAGGIRNIEDIRKILYLGADKVAINTAAIKNPELIREARRVFGSQCIVLSMEVQNDGRGNYECYVDYGRQRTGVDALEWAKQATELGAGEIMLTSVNYEGTGDGFDTELTAKISKSVPIPVVACGGAGSLEDFHKVITEGYADAVSAASVFHYRYAKPVDSLWMQLNEPRLRMGEQLDSGNIDFLNHGFYGNRDLLVQPLSIKDVKTYLTEKGLPIRLQSNNLGVRAAE
jgi:imidazole glycerol-phosphate synthase subunit HisF